MIPAEAPASTFHISQRISYSSHICTVRYIGPVTGTSGTWLGVEWDNPTLGKHAGEHNGVKYFSCLSSLPTAASFVRPTRPYDQPRSFLDALRDKYVAEASPFTPAPKKQIYFNGKLAQEIGFEKVAAQQAALGELRIVVLDAFRVAGVSASDDENSSASSKMEDLIEEIKQTCGNIQELNLGRNLIETWSSIAGICQGLSKLRKLVLDGNRIHYEAPDSGIHLSETAFLNIEELSIAGTLLPWDEIMQFTRLFPKLGTLSLASNDLSGPIPTLELTHLTSLNLSYNPLVSFEAIVPLSKLSNLSTLTLRSCSLESLTALPCHFLSLKHLDISSNSISSFTELNYITSIFPTLASLHCVSNPFYSSLSHEEAHMLTVARIPSINMLNYSRISDKERENAELYYLSKIRTELGKGASDIEQNHPLFRLLAETHGQTEDIAAAAAEAREALQMHDEDGILINPSSLGARLADLTFKFTSDVELHKNKGSLVLTVPKSVSVYRLKSLVGRSIGRYPRLFKLVWETGELDPVGRNIGNPGRVGEGLRIADAESEDEDEDEDDERSDAQRSKGDKEDAGTDGVKWIKREVELFDSTRPIGDWIEGRRADIRIELVDKDKT